MGGSDWPRCIKNKQLHPMFQVCLVNLVDQVNRVDQVYQMILLNQVNKVKISYLKSASYEGSQLQEVPLPPNV